MGLGDLTRQAFEAWNERRITDLLAYFDERIVWDMTPFGLPGVGEYRGHQGFRRFVSDWLEAFPDSSIAVEEVEERGPWTYAIVIQSVTGGASGAAVPFRYGGIGRWEDEKLVFVQNHSDLAQGRAAYEEFVRSFEAVGVE